MKLVYTDIKDESSMLLTNFNCEPSQQLLQDRTLYKIIWGKDAATTVVVDGYTIPLEKNQVIFCTPLNIVEVPRKYGILAIVFNRDFYCIRDHDAEVSCNGFLFFGSSLPPVITLDEENIKSFDAIFHVFQEEFRTEDHIQGEMLRVMLKRLLIKSSRLLKKELPDNVIPNAQLDIVRKYHILVEQYFREKHKVSDYADLLYKSPKTLSNLFKKMGNLSPLKVINERIVLEAKRLLLYSDKTAEEIGYELGFKEAAHFSKFFKKQVGMPPVEFKKNVSASA